MARYEYRCPEGHSTEVILPIGEAPEEITCRHCPMPWVESDDGSCEEYQLVTTAHRVYSPPIAIHFKGPGFYSTDVKGRVERKRRPNPGDDLYKPYDHAAARIADAA